MIFMDYKRFLLTIFFCLFAVITTLADTDDNVIVSSKYKSYVIREKDGVPLDVKMREEFCFLALATDGEANVATTYGSQISLDKASAPNAKPYYRSWNSSDVFYDGSRVCYMSVPLKKGKEAKVVFERSYKKPEFFSNIYLVDPYYTAKALTELKVAASLADKIKVTPYNLQEGMTFSSEFDKNGDMVYKVECEDIEAYKSEPSAPTAGADAPQLLVSGLFDGTTGIYRFVRNFTDIDDRGGDKVAALAKELREKAPTDDALVDSTAAWVQNNIRYLAIEHEEFAMRPTPAEEVLSARAGDCKCSANLIRALLRRNGIDSRLVWVGTKKEIPYSWREQPSLAAGNHVVAAAFLNDSVRFLDGTTKWAPAGYLHPNIRGKEVMVEDGDLPAFITVPQLPSVADTYSVKADYEIMGEDLKGNISHSFSGVWKMNIMGLIDEVSPAKRNTFLEQTLRYPKNNASLSGITLVADRTSPTVEFSASVTEKGSAKKIGEKIYLDLRPIRDLFSDVVDVKDRKRDLDLDYPYSAEFSYTVRILDGFKVESMPESAEISDKWTRGVVNYSVEGDRIICSATLEIKEDLVPLASIEERNATIRKLRRLSETRIVLAPATPAAKY